MRAPAASAIAVACGTPMPSTPRLVHAWPGPTPTRTPTAPVRMRCSAVEYDAQPPTITGRSNSRMNFLRLSGWRDSSFDTCSADTTVPWITRTSSSASSTMLGVLLDALRRERRARGDAAVLDLADALADELVLDRLGVDLLHAPRRLLGRQRRRSPRRAARDPRSASTGLRGSGTRGRRGCRSRSRSAATRRRPSPRPSSAARTCTRRSPSVMSTSSGSRVRRLGHDRDVVEPVGPPAGLADPDLDFHGPSAWLACRWEGSRIPRSGETACSTQRPVGEVLEEARRGCARSRPRPSRRRARRSGRRGRARSGPSAADVPALLAVDAGRRGAPRAGRRTRARPRRVGSERRSPVAGARRTA